MNGRTLEQGTASVVQQSISKQRRPIYIHVMAIFEFAKAD
jgi:hypothetical protein